MGTPCTLGQGLLDYRLSDADTTPPQSQRHWPERFVLVPSPHALFDADLPFPPSSRRDFGVPDDALVLCHFDLPFRIGPEVFDVWMRLLAQVPKAVLLLLDAGKLFNANLRARARERSIDAARLLFAPASPYQAHLGCLPHADLFLDTFFYSARSMAFNALRAGVPVLTCPGATMASRLAVPFLRSMGLDDLIVDSVDAYERKALELATDREALARIKQRVTAARQTAPAFDTVGRVRAVERAFVAMVERHRAGLPPDTLVVD
jgi:predicted O-linked N-acetylglucosamine transferase (SPINDLY family)